MTVSDVKIGHVFQQGESLYVRIDPRETRFAGLAPLPVVAVRLVGGIIGQVLAMPSFDRVDAMARNLHADMVKVADIG